MAPLHLGVLLAAGWSVLALIFAFRRTRAFGTRRLFAPAAGDAAAGVRYAFTLGMAPQAKESVRLNPASYLAGVLYHLGLFAAMVRLGLRLGGLRPPRALALLALLGAMGGLALLLKRSLKADLRAFSSPDDFLANLLVTAFAVLAGLSALWAGLEGPWMAASILLFAYVPLGKLRHCVFFFPTRYHSGAFFGRRGVFPPGAGRA